MVPDRRRPGASVRGGVRSVPGRALRGCREQYRAEAFDGLSHDLFVKALSAEGIPSSKGYPRGCHEHPLFLDQKGRDTWPYNRLLTDRSIDYASMSCPTTEHLCRDETVWLSGTFMLEAGREGMEQVGEAIEKIRENRHELISRARATE